MKLPKTRREAILLEVDKYFDGKPCKKGHIAEKSVNGYACCECHREACNRYTQTEEQRQKRVARYRRIHQENPWVHAFNRARERAKRKGIEFSVSIDDVQKVWPKDGKCPILGIKLIPRILMKDGTKSKTNSPSLDRLDSSKGYVKGNIAVISTRANLIKNDGTIEEHAKIVEWMKERMGLKL